MTNKWTKNIGTLSLQLEDVLGMNFEEKNLKLPTSSKN